MSNNQTSFVIVILVAVILGYFVMTVPNRYPGDVKVGTTDIQTPHIVNDARQDLHDMVNDTKEDLRNRK